MPLIKWAVVDEWKRLYRVTDHELAGRMGYSASQLCDVRKGRREVSGHFLDCLCYELRMVYDDIAVHPRLKAPAEPARKALGIQRMDNGRQWPATDPANDLLTHQQARQKERETAHDLLRRPFRRIERFLKMRP